MRTYERTGGRLRPEDAARCVRAAVASNRMEGRPTPADEEAMLLRLMLGDITEAEYAAWVLERAGVGT